MTASTIAAGGQPPFRYALTHPEHGELVFTAPSPPTARQTLEHSIAVDDFLGGRQMSELQPQTVLLAQGLAALVQSRLIQLPVVREDRVDDPDDDAIRVTRIFYDPEGEQNTGIIVEVWLAWLEWRTSLLSQFEEVKSAVGEASGETQPVD